MPHRGVSGPSWAEEEAAYEAVAEEIDQGIRRQGLWAKAIAEAEGSEELARAIYIRLRVQSLMDERFQQEEGLRRAEKLQREQRDAALQLEQEQRDAAKRNAPTEFEIRSAAMRSNDKA